MTNSSFRNAILMAGIVLATASSGLAQPPGFGGFSDEALQQKFAEYDRNRDGRVSYDEASDRTKPYFKSADKNNDGHLDFGEYKGYVEERMAQFRGGPPRGGPPSSSSSGDSSDSSRRDSSSYRGGYRSDSSSSSSDRKSDSKTDSIPKPIAIRFGKLPDELPDWFRELDIDRDGQIGLYEWRKDDRETEEFLAVDANDDGLLTAEEWIRSEKRAEEKKKLDELLAVAGGALPTASDKSDDKKSSKSSKSSRSGRGDNPFSRR